MVPPAKRIQVSQILTADSSFAIEALTGEALLGRKEEVDSNSANCTRITSLAQWQSDSLISCVCTGLVRDLSSTLRRGTSTTKKGNVMLQNKPCKDIVFHFNRGHLADPSIPMWVLKTGGETYYVNHVDAECSWSTKETPNNPATKGSLKFKKCILNIDDKLNATITNYIK